MIKQQSSTDHFFEGHFYETATCAARRATFLERSFRVVPAVLVRAQVLRNNLGATFLPAEEITDDWAAEWNGVPVLVGPHPSTDGQASSGRTPELWNERGVGWIFNAHVDTREGVRRLLGEVWLDESRAAVVTGFQAVLDRLDAGQPVELSTGFSTSLDEEPGVYNGQQYELVLHPSGADHLVISIEMTGACSVLHGCGLGTNQEAKVEDKDKQTKDGTVVASTDAPTPGGKMKALLSRVAELFLVKSTRKDLSYEDRQALQVGRVVAIADQQGMSDRDKAEALEEALEELWGAKYPDFQMNDNIQCDAVVSDVFSDEKQVVWWMQTPMGPMPSGDQFYRSTYSDDGSGQYTVSEPEMVQRVTRYEPVAPEPVAGNVAPPVTESLEMIQAVTNLRAATEQLEKVLV